MRDDDGDDDDERDDEEGEEEVGAAVTRVEERRMRRERMTRARRSMAFEATKKIKPRKGKEKSYEPEEEDLQRDQKEIRLSQVKNNLVCKINYNGVE